MFGPNQGLTIRKIYSAVLAKVCRGQDLVSQLSSKFAEPEYFAQLAKLQLSLQTPVHVDFACTVLDALVSEWKKRNTTLRQLIRRTQLKPLALTLSSLLVALDKEPGPTVSLSRFYAVCKECFALFHAWASKKETRYGVGLDGMASSLIALDKELFLACRIPYVDFAIRASQQPLSQLRAIVSLQQVMEVYYSLSLLHLGAYLVLL